MRLDKSWIIVRKEMSEFRKNKYILYTLVLMPIVMAVVLPITYLIPLSSLAGTPATEPLPLHITVDQTIVGGGFNANTTEPLMNIHFIGTNLTNVVILSCEIEGCNVTTSVIRDSNFTRTTVIQSTVVHSNFFNSTTVNTVSANSVFVGQKGENQGLLLTIVNFLMMFFILIPVIIPTVIASYSFVGEKLNKSLEPLLATPLTDAELLAGKSLSIFVPTMVVTWIAFIPFSFIVDLVAGPPLGFLPIPDALWLLGVFVLGPLFCILSILLSVMVSARVTDVRSSQQIGGLIVLPVVVFFVIAISGFVALNVLFMLLFCGIIGLADIGVFFLAKRVFAREEILVRWK
jgi:ABC-2 type transport system permease protein